MDLVQQLEKIANGPQVNQRDPNKKHFERRVASARVLNVCGEREREKKNTKDMVSVCVSRIKEDQLAAVLTLASENIGKHGCRKQGLGELDEEFLEEAGDIVTFGLVFSGLEHIVKAVAHLGVVKYFFEVADLLDRSGLSHESLPVKACKGKLIKSMSKESNSFERQRGTQSQEKKEQFP
jgi:hypothetical protein